MAKVLVLGATSPIARALALKLARDGDHLYLAARDAREAQRIAQDLQVRSGVGALAGGFDAADTLSHPEFFKRTLGELGGLDGAVLCFGTLGDAELATRDPDEAVAIVDQNFTGAVSILTLIASHLEAQGSGYIVALGSVAGERGRAGNYSYGAAKGALALFLGGMRARLARRGVRVMTVKLGTVDTRMTFGSGGIGARLAISPERAAEKIHAAMRRRREVVFIPGFWRPIMAVVRLIPERFFKFTRF